MAAMTTTLTEHSSNGDSRTYTAPTHTIGKPVLFLQKRRSPVGNQVIAEDTVSVLHGADDSNGDPLTQKVLFSCTVRRHYDVASADIDAAKALFREFVASTNFDAVVSTQANVQ